MFDVLLVNVARERERERERERGGGREGGSFVLCDGMLVNVAKVYEHALFHFVVCWGMLVLSVKFIAKRQSV